MAEILLKKRHVSLLLLLLLFLLFFSALGTSFAKALEISKQIIVNYVRLGSTNCLQVLPNEFVKQTATKR